MTQSNQAAPVLTPDQILNQLEAALTAAGVNVTATLLVNFFSSISATPTIQNVVAQVVILMASAPMQLPVLEGQVINALATAGLAIVAWAQTQLPVPVPPAS